MDNATLEHPNSHTVYFRRKPVFADENRPELAEYFSDSKINIGSYFAKGSTRTATGLTIQEEDLLMPYILGIPKDDREFRREVTKYFSNIDSKIPADSVPLKDTDGLALQIGLSEDNSKPVSADNLPLNVEDFVRWRQAKGHPWAAASEPEAKGNQLIKFFVTDPKQVSTQTISQNDLKDDALTQYLVIKASAQKVRMYLILLGINPITIKRGDEATRLRSIAETRPADFLKVVNDKDKEMLYIIRDMVQLKVLEKVGASILTNDGTVIGNTEREASIYLRDTRNSKVLVSLKALLQEAYKKNSISVETEEDLDKVETPAAGFKESDEQLEARLAAKAAQPEPTKVAPPVQAAPLKVEKFNPAAVNTRPGADYIPDSAQAGSGDNEATGSQLDPNEKITGNDSLDEIE